MKRWWNGPESVFFAKNVKLFYFENRCISRSEGVFPAKTSRKSPSAFSGGGHEAEARKTTGRETEFRTGPGNPPGLPIPPASEPENADDAHRLHRRPEQRFCSRTASRRFPGIRSGDGLPANRSAEGEPNVFSPGSLPLARAPGRAKARSRKDRPKRKTEQKLQKTKESCTRAARRKPVPPGKSPTRRRKDGILRIGRRPPDALRPRKGGRTDTPHRRTNRNRICLPEDRRNVRQPLPCGTEALRLRYGKGIRKPDARKRGKRGIRTPGTLQFNGFQDRRNRPLCHLSEDKSITDFPFRQIPAALISPERPEKQRFTV